MAGEIVEWIRTCVSLTKDMDSIPKTHMIASKHPYLKFQKIRIFLLASIKSVMYVVDRNACRQNTQTHNIKISKSFGNSLEITIHVTCVRISQHKQ